MPAHHNIADIKKLTDNVTLIIYCSYVLLSMTKNQSLFFKWWWRYSEDENSLWKRIIKSLHNIKGIKASKEVLGTVKERMWSQMMKKDKEVEVVRRVLGGHHKQNRKRRQNLVLTGQVVFPSVSKSAVPWTSFLIYASVKWDIGNKRCGPDN